MLNKLTEVEDFINNEYSSYKSTTNDPMEFDDWLAGNDCVEVVEANKLFKELSVLRG